MEWFHNESEPCGQTRMSHNGFRIWAEHHKSANQVLWLTPTWHLWSDPHHPPPIQSHVDHSHADTWMRNLIFLQNRWWARTKSGPPTFWILPIKKLRPKRQLQLHVGPIKKRTQQRVPWFGAASCPHFPFIYI